MHQADTVWSIHLKPSKYILFFCMEVKFAFSIEVLYLRFHMFNHVIYARCISIMFETVILL